MTKLVSVPDPDSARIKHPGRRRAEGARIIGTVGLESTAVMPSS